MKGIETSVYYSGDRWRAEEGTEIPEAIQPLIKEFEEFFLEELPISLPPIRDI